MDTRSISPKSVSSDIVSQAAAGQKPYEGKNEKSNGAAQDGASNETLEETTGKKSLAEA